MLRTRPRPAGAEGDLERAIQDWGVLGPHARAALAQTYSVLLDGDHPGDVVEQHGQALTLRGERLARKLGKAIEVPLQTLGLAVGAIPPEIDTYTVLLCEALQVYARGRRRATKEVSTYWDSVTEEETNDK